MLVIRTWLIAGLLLLMAAPFACADPGDPDESHSVWIAGWLTLSSEGDVTAYEPDPDYPVPETLQGAAGDLVRATKFEPARLEGEGRVSRSWLRGRLRLQPQGDTYAVVLQEPYLGPRANADFFPRGIAPPLKPARMVLSFRVEEDGRARDVQVESLDGVLPSGLARRLEDRVRWLRFEPVEVDGAPVATHVRQPLAIYRFGREVAAFNPPGLARDPGQPAAVGQTAYAPEVHLTATSITSGSFRP